MCGYDYNIWRAIIIATFGARFRRCDVTQVSSLNHHVFMSQTDFKFSDDIRSTIPTRRAAAIFRLKAAALQMRRGVCDIAQKMKRHAPLSREQRLEYSMLWAESRTPLWDESRPQESALQCGKVQNLRAALRHLDGAFVPQNQLFSFWKQIGRATKRRGFEQGRLLREGCVIPAIGGGLCQLSNALYDLALRCGMQIVERHAHSQIVAGSVAQNGRDATVAWNYIDLRFRAPHDFLVETFLSRDELVVRFRAKEKHQTFVPLTFKTQHRVLDVENHNCVSCAQTTCFRHVETSTTQGATAFLLDENWLEWNDFLRAQKSDCDLIVVPMRAESWIGGKLRSSWQTDDFDNAHNDARDVPFSSLQRLFAVQRASSIAEERLAQIFGSAKIARAMARHLAPDVTHVCVAQSLLPHLWRSGVLGGRTFEVLMTQLPLSETHRRLDEAAQRFPERASLREFRAPQTLVELENQALQNATQIVTPHREIASMYQDRVLEVAWHQPQHVKIERNSTKTILFPGPTTARKGAYEIRKIARELGLNILLTGRNLESASFWSGIETRQIAKTAIPWQEIVAVVQPSLFEAQPRLLLEAQSFGVPIISTRGCGLTESESVTFAPFGDMDALRTAMQNVLHEYSTTQSHA